MISSYEIPIGPARKRLIQTIEYRDEYRGGAPAAVTFTWRGKYADGTWTFHPVQRYRAQDGCGGGHTKPQDVPDGHVERVWNETTFDDADVEVHSNCPLYCGLCDGRLA